MSRSGYSDDCEDWWAHICWRGAVASAVKGKRGQAFLHEMLAALNALESRRLIANELAMDGEVCAIGAVGAARSIDMSAIDPEDRESVAGAFGIAAALAAEIVWVNDEAGAWKETAEARYERMRRWVEAQIVARDTTAQAGVTHEGGDTAGDSGNGEAASNTRSPRSGDAP